MKNFAMLAVAVTGLSFASVGTAQDVPRLLRTHGDLDAVVLVGVKAAAPERNDLAVLTDPTPAVHLFRADGYRSWGRAGGGPAELASPVDLAWSERSLLVLDVGHRKIVSFAEDSRFVEMRGLEDWANRIFVVAGDTVLGTFRPMDRARAIVRVRGAVRDTILAYAQSANEVRLEAPGAPSLTVARPFTPQPRWTVLPDGLIAVWLPGNDYIRLLDVHGRDRGRVHGVGRSVAVRAEDRERWLRDAIPQAFMGQRVFEPIRRRAREVMAFPDEFPPVMELKGDPSGGIWIRKNTAGTGQLWHRITRHGTQLGSMRLPVGRRLLHVGPAELIVWGEDELGVERIEIYAGPG